MSYEDLCLACADGDIGRVQKLACEVADINATNSRGWNALIMAAFNQHFSIVQYLVEYCGADVNASSAKGTTVFMYAKTKVLESRDTRLLEYLISRGASINATDRFGKTVLDYVREKENGGWLASWLEARGGVSAQEIKGIN